MKRILAHCIGKRDAASREWIYQWFANNPQADKVVETVFTRDYRLYGDGRFFKWSSDLHETEPLDSATLPGAAKAAHADLQSAHKTSRAGFERPSGN